MPGEARRVSPYDQDDQAPQGVQHQENLEYQHNQNLQERGLRLKAMKTNLINKSAKNANQVSHYSFFPKTTTQDLKPLKDMGFAILVRRYLVEEEKKPSGTIALERPELALMMSVRLALRKRQSSAKKNKNTK